MRRFDPGYLVRSRPADADDSILCDLFARRAVHSVMAAKTGLVTRCWSAVLAATGRPGELE